jgi:hypothetical protein
MFLSRWIIAHRRALQGNPCAMFHCQINEAIAAQDRGACVKVVMVIDK